MEIPVDGLILRSSGVIANESAMTGESQEVRKEPLENCTSKYEEKSYEIAFAR